MNARLALAILFAAGVVVVPRGEAHAQLPRVGLISIGTNPDRPTNWEPFFEESRRLGYVEGRKAARALGLTMPPSIAARTDR